MDYYITPSCLRPSPQLPQDHLLVTQLPIGRSGALVTVPPESSLSSPCRSLYLPKPFHTLPDPQAPLTICFPTAAENPIGHL